MPAPLPRLRTAVAITALLSTAAVPLAFTGASADAVPGPIHAGNTFGWYRSHLWRQEFVGRKPGFWHVHGPGLVQDQHGMLTLNTRRRGTVSATLRKAGHRTGRWEIRMRSRRYETRHTDYKVVTKLIPAGTRKQHCGGRDVSLESYHLGTSHVRFYIHTLPDLTFRSTIHRSLRNDQWHTWAVEVTRHRISWFVDAHVIRTEKRPKALSGVPLTLRFSMVGVPGKRMNQSRMQMDWMRYWRYDTPDTKSTKAPRTHKASFHRAC